MGVLFVHVDPIRISGPDVKVAPFTAACGVVAWVNVFHLCGFKSFTYKGR